MAKVGKPRNLVPGFFSLEIKKHRFFGHHIDIIKRNFL